MCEFSDGNLLNSLPDLDKLRCSGFRMRFKPSALGPLIGLVVVIDIPRSLGR